MAFLLEGNTISFFDNSIDEENSLLPSAFEDAARIREPIDALVECSLPTRCQQAIFHVTGWPSIKGNALLFKVTEYVTWPEEANLNKLESVSFTGPCINSFKPKQCSIALDTLKVSIPSPETTKISGGTAKILGRNVTLESIAGYRFSGDRQELVFTSTVKANVCDADLKFLRELYLTVRGAIEFCIGRSNLEISASLDFDNALVSGDYVAFRDPAAIPDELDGFNEQFVRADDIGESLSLVLEAICSKKNRASLIFLKPLRFQHSDSNESHRANRRIRKRVRPYLFRRGCPFGKNPASKGGSGSQNPGNRGAPHGRERGAAGRPPQ